jgi:hypothetical protein
MGLSQRGQHVLALQLASQHCMCSSGIITTVVGKATHMGHSAMLSYSQPEQARLGALLAVRIKRSNNEN